MRQFKSFLITWIIFNGLALAQNIFSAQSSYQSAPSSSSKKDKEKIQWQRQRKKLAEKLMANDIFRAPVIPVAAADGYESKYESKEEKRESTIHFYEKSSGYECPICYETTTKDNPNVAMQCTSGDLHAICKKCFITMAKRAPWRFNTQLKHFYPRMKCNVCSRQYDSHDFSHIEKFVSFEQIYQDKLKQEDEAEENINIQRINIEEHIHAQEDLRNILISGLQIIGVFAAILGESAFSGGLISQYGEGSFLGGALLGVLDRIVVFAFLYFIDYLRHR